MRSSRRFFPVYMFTGMFLAAVFGITGCSGLMTSFNPATQAQERVLREGAFLNQELLDDGLAVPYAG